MSDQIDREQQKHGARNHFERLLANSDEYDKLSDEAKERIWRFVSNDFKILQERMEKLMGKRFK